MAENGAMSIIPAERSHDPYTEGPARDSSIERREAKPDEPDGPVHNRHPHPPGGSRQSNQSDGRTLNQTDTIKKLRSAAQQREEWITKYKKRIAIFKDRIAGYKAQSENLAIKLRERENLINEYKLKLDSLSRDKAIVDLRLTEYERQLAEHVNPSGGLLSEEASQKKLARVQSLLQERDRRLVSQKAQLEKMVTKLAHRNKLIKQLRATIRKQSFSLAGVREVLTRLCVEELERHFPDWVPEKS